MPFVMEKKDYVIKWEFCYPDQKLHHTLSLVHWTPNFLYCVWYLTLVKKNIFLSCRDQGIIYLNVRCKSSEKETHSLFIFQKSQKVDRGKSPQKLYVHEFPTNRNLCVAFCVRSKGLNGQNHSLLDSHP